MEANDEVNTEIGIVEEILQKAKTQALSISSRSGISKVCTWLIASRF